MEWKDPTECKNVKKTDKYIAVSFYYHKIFPEGRGVIPSEGLKKIDDKDWELFHTNEENEEFYWGMFVEGIGMMSVMIPKNCARELLEEEKSFWSKRRMGMFGSHSGKLSYTFEMPEIK